jgi:tetratricopeptide (TPR) repeat protein
VPAGGSHAEEVTRRDDLGELAGVLADKSTAVLAAVVGEGGMGKSSLAIRLCREHRQNYQVVGWLTATDVTAWRSSVEYLAAKLGVPGADVAELWRVLAHHGPALVVVDDAPEPASFEPLPWHPSVHVVVTSRSVRWRSVAQVRELGPLRLREATEYLLARTGAEDEDAAAEVATRLGGYPLALDQVAAAVVDGLSLRGWQERHGTTSAEDLTALHTAWGARIAGLRGQHPDALALLRVLTCVGASPVPAALLSEIGAGAPELAVCADSPRRDAAVADLRRQGLIRTGADVETMFVHPLLAEVIRADPEFDHGAVALRVADAAGTLLDESDVDDASTWPRISGLISAAVAGCHLVLECADAFTLEALAGLANHALWLPAAYLHERGAAGEAYRVRLLGIAMHGDVAAARAVRRWTGTVLGVFHDLDEAEVLPADSLGHVPGARERLSVARWLSEIASILTDVDLGLAEDYARRGLGILPRRAALVSNSGPVPWTARIKIELLDFLGFILMLREDYRAATETLRRALRLQRSFEGGRAEYKYAELLNDHALALLDAGLSTRAAREFAEAARLAEATGHPDSNVGYNIDNNLAIAEREAGHLRSAHRRLVAGLEWLWDREDPRSSHVVIQQCNAGLAAYDLGATEEGRRQVRGAYQTLVDRLGEDDRETVVRRVMLAGLQLAEGDLKAANEGVLADLALSEGNPASPWVAVRRVQSAWLTGVAALTPDVAVELATALVDGFGGRGRHAAAGLDFATAAVLADAGEYPDPDGAREARAVRAVALHTAAVGRDHPRTLLALARLALLRADTSGRRVAVPRLLATPDALTCPGTTGFDADLARHGQPPVDRSRPAWEADRVLHLLADEVVDLDAGEQLCWQANAGRLAAVGRAEGAAAVLRDAAAGSAALYGPYHWWTVLRDAAAAVADGEAEALRVALTAPQWI